MKYLLLSFTFRLILLILLSLSFVFGKTHGNSTADIELFILKLNQQNSGNEEFNCLFPDLKFVELEFFGAAEFSGSDSMVCAGLGAREFDNLAAVQFSQNWNPDLLSYGELKNFNFSGMNSSNFKSGQANNGVLRFSYNPSGDPMSVPYNAIIYEICYEVTGSIGQVANINFSSTSVPIDAVVEIDGVVESVTPALSNGKITIEGDSDGLTFVGEQNINGPLGETVCMDISVINFEDVLAFQFLGFEWDATGLEFESFSTLNLPGNIEVNLNQVNEGRISYSVWDNPAGVGLSILDSTPIARICFYIIGECEQIYPVTIAGGPLGIEVFDDNFNPIPAIGESGYIEVECLFCNLSIQSYLFLEGALLDPSSAGEYLSEMRTNLNSSRVLPGQTYFSFLFGSNYTPPGQPYSVNPWNYFGSEGEAFDSEGNMANSDADYPSTVVDWVLVTLRPGSSPVSPAVWRTAALLHKDGSVELLRSLPCCSVDESLSYYLMIQHRNHMPVMSHQAVQFVNGVLTYDFRSQDSYIFDIFGFGAVGQKEVESGVYAMFTGNGDQTIANQSQIEINFNDKQRFDEDLGIQQQYSIGDYNLDGNVQFNDKLALIENLGSQSSVSPVSSVATSEVEIDCESAELNGSLSEGEAAEEVWIEISYTSGCGEYAGQEIASTGVEGLTATLEAGVFQEEGGVLVLSISGTPNSGGMALFLLNIAGETCSLEVAVESSGPSYPTGTVHCDPDNPTEIVEVLNPATGRIWMDRNLGAGRVAQSSTDSEAYGDLYQWGRGADGHQCRNSPTTTTLSSTDQPGHGDFILAPSQSGDWRNPQNNNLWQGVNGINNPCPEGFRVPTRAELSTELSSWSSSNAAGAFASPLKLPVAGLRERWGSFSGVGTYVNYWSSTVRVGTDESHRLFFSSSNARTLGYRRGGGFSVRCLKD